VVLEEDDEPPHAATVKATAARDMAAVARREKDM